MDERRKKGLCSWCGVKFILGHRCIRSQLYHILIDQVEEVEGDLEEFLDCTETLEDEGHKDSSEGYNTIISLHALMGTEGCQTMRLMGKIKKQVVVMLINSGSTHNFIDQTMAKKLKCSTTLVTGVSVTVANGDILQAQEMCTLMK